LLLFVRQPAKNNNEISVCFFVIPLSCIVAYCVYKLVKSLTDKQKAQEEKKKLKQQRREKEKKK
jgi:phosphate/sulfate permease